MKRCILAQKSCRGDESEAAIFDIATKEILKDFPPLVAGVPSAFFCEFYQEIDLKGSKTIPLVVEIKAQFIDDAIISNKEKITLDYAPVARVGKSYALLGKNITPPTIK